MIGVQDLTGVYRGRLIEQIVGQELKTTVALTDASLVFWVRDKAQSQAEVDFLVTTEHGVVPVEAKSGTAGKLRSLHQFMLRSDAKLAVRLYAGTPNRQEIDLTNGTYSLLNIPYYAGSLISRYLMAEGIPSL